MRPGDLILVSVDVAPASGQGGIPPSRSDQPVTMALNQLASALES
jgi:hypothetical protein